MPPTTERHLHTFSEPLPDEPYKRRCRDCGEPQVYRAPSGQGVEFTDVLVDKQDLRDLIESYRELVSIDCVWSDKLCSRLEALINP